MAAKRDAGLMNNGAATKGIGKRGLQENPRYSEAAPTLAEAGIDKNLADRARTLAAISEEEFDGKLDNWREWVDLVAEKVFSGILAPLFQARFVKFR